MIHDPDGRSVRSFRSSQQFFLVHFLASLEQQHAQQQHVVVCHEEESKKEYRQNMLLWMTSLASSRWSSRRARFTIKTEGVHVVFPRKSLFLVHSCFVGTTRATPAWGCGRLSRRRKQDRIQAMILVDTEERRTILHVHWACGAIGHINDTEKRRTILHVHEPCACGTIGHNNDNKQNAPGRFWKKSTVWPWHFCSLMLTIITLAHVGRRSCKSPWPVTMLKL